jgi:hypothetical protein
MDVHPTKNVSIGIDPYPYTYSSPGTVDFPSPSSVVVNLGEDAEHLAQRVGTPVKRLGMPNMGFDHPKMWGFMMIYDDL